MSYCPSSSPSRQAFLPGIASLTDGRRTNHDRMTSDESAPFQQSFDMQGLPEFANMWSVVNPRGKAPQPCSGQTVVYWPATHSIVTGYGRKSDESFSSEFWKFSLDDQEWTKLEIPDVTPRAACGAALVDNTLWFYGGMTEKSFTRDLHYVDLITQEVTYPITSGDPPPECALPLVAYHNNHLIVWAGTSGSNLSSLHVLDTEEMNWRRIETDFIGRQGACGAIIEDTLYIFGASCAMSIIALDLNTYTFTLVPTTGVEPPHGLECLTTVANGTNLIAFETVSTSSKPRFFVYDTLKSHWMSSSMSLATNPDKEKEEIPKIVFYIPDDRKLLALYDSESEIAEQMSEIPIGRSIAALNQRMDILAMLPPQ